MQVLGNVVSAFLDLRDSQQPVVEGTYEFEESERDYLPDIQDNFWIYNIRREPTVSLDGKPGLVDVYSTTKTITEVFSTADAKPSTYVSRDYNGGATYESVIWLAMNDPGRVLVLHGPSKLGKTALWKGVVEALVIDCHPNRVPADIYAEIHAALGSPHQTESALEFTSDTALSADLTAGLAGGGPGQAGAKLGWSQKETAKESVKASHPAPVVGSRQVAMELATAQRALIFENFHRLNDETLREVAYSLRTFSDVKVSTFFVGIPDDPYRLVGHNPELEGRLTFLDFDFWKREDLRKIALRGQEALNIEFTDETLDFITSEAAGSPLLMQEFCLLACLASRIDRSQEERTPVEINEKAFKQAMKNFVIHELRHYEAIQTLLIAQAAKIKSLPSDCIQTIVAHLRARPTLSVPMSALRLGKNPVRSLKALVKRVNEFPLAQDLLAIDVDKRIIKICRPMYLPYIRWIAA